jgi:hypothetical protein
MMISNCWRRLQASRDRRIEPELRVDCEGAVCPRAIATSAASQYFAAAAPTTQMAATTVAVSTR